MFFFVHSNVSLNWINISTLHAKEKEDTVEMFCIQKLALILSTVSSIICYVSTFQSLYFKSHFFLFKFNFTLNLIITTSDCLLWYSNIQWNYRVTSSAIIRIIIQIIIVVRIYTVLIVCRSDIIKTNIFKNLGYLTSLAPYFNFANNVVVPNKKCNRLKQKIIIY